MDPVSETTTSETEPAVQAWMDLLAMNEPEPSSITPMSTAIDVADRVAPPPPPKVEEKDASPLDTGELAAARPPKLAPTLFVAGAAALVVGAIAMVLGGHADRRTTEAANASLTMTAPARTEIEPPPLPTEAPVTSSLPAPEPPKATPPAAKETKETKETAPAPAIAATRAKSAPVAKPAPPKTANKAKPAPQAPKKGKPADAKKR